jgi:hypothetical protein
MNPHVAMTAHLARRNAGEGYRPQTIRRLWLAVQRAAPYAGDPLPLATIAETESLMEPDKGHKTHEHEIIGSQRSR